MSERIHGGLPMRSSCLLRTSIVAGIVALMSTTAKSEELSGSDSAFGDALAYQSTQSSDCLSLAAARSLHPRSHLYWHGSHHCWDASPTGAHGARARSSKPEHVARSSKPEPTAEKPEPATEFAAATPAPDQEHVDNAQPIAMLTDYLAFDMVLEEWRQMSRGLVTPLVDEATSEFDHRWSQR
jgi:hypothetical protein